MSDTPTSNPNPVAKEDPETLVLRARPPRAVRFKRGAIVGIAALASTAVIGVTWVALKPATWRIVADGDSAELANTAPPDALAGAPASYGDVPQLGPPLPGDLGGPILEQSQALGTAPPQGIDQAEQAAEAKRLRIAAEKKAARESSVMLQLASVSPAAAVTANPVPDGDASQTDVDKPVIDPARDPNSQARKNALVGKDNRNSILNPHGLVEPISPDTLMAGSVIAASLITGLNSDLPGLVTAQVTQHVYDSVTGQHLLIPQGSRLIGSYDSVVAFGQSRALVVWQRIILPDGSSIRIDNVPAADTQGYAGLSDRIDRHTWQLLKGVGFSTLLGIGTELGSGNSDSDLVRAIRDSTQQARARAGDQLVSRNLDVQPTIRVRPGWPVRIVVHKDIVLREWGGGHG